MLERLKVAFGKELDFFLSVPAAIWQILFFGVPILLIVALSFIQFDGPFQFPRLTLVYYLSLLEWPIAKIILRSIFLAAIASICSFLIAYPFSYFLVMKIKRFKVAFLFLLILPFWTNFLLQVYGWYYILDDGGLVNQTFLYLGLISSPLHMLNNFFAVNLLMIYCYLPFMILPIYSSLEKLDKSLIEASLDLGATPLQTLFNVTIPLTKVGIKIGTVLVLVPAFGEFAIPSLMGGGKDMYVGSLVSHFFLTARNSSRGAAFTCLSVLILFAFVGLVFYTFFPKNDLMEEEE
ncbi:MAG: Spermidine/putrescine transport system permease protein potB [candidate division TM6 bacterium GW2011_GWF2_32_72]|nr:MAG: Spermidine/putrescine transport system permease protein potB [candidate division TM6 bacterium GW2011_GWF2_32_72]